MLALDLPNQYPFDFRSVYPNMPYASTRDNRSERRGIAFVTMDRYLDSAQGRPIYLCQEPFATLFESAIYFGATNYLVHPRLVARARDNRWSTAANRCPTESRHRSRLSRLKQPPSKRRSSVAIEQIFLCPVVNNQFTRLAL